MAVQDNAYGRAVYAADNQLSANEEDDNSVYGVVYIAAESDGGAWQPKPSQPGGNPGFQPPEPPSPAQQGRCQHRRTFVYSAIGVAVLIAIIVGASVGSRRQQHAQPTAGPSPAGTPEPISPAAAKAAVVTTVPFSVRAAVIPPASYSQYSCDTMFGTDEVVSRYTTSLEAAYAAQLSPNGAATINITKVTCNGVIYHLPSEARTADGAPPPNRRLQQLNPGGYVLEVVTELTVQLHEYVQDTSVSKETLWMTQIRRSAGEISSKIMPTVLADVFKVTVTSSTVQVLQLPGVIISSSSSSSETPADASVTARQQTVVTRTTTDPSTGNVVDTKVLTLPSSTSSRGADTTADSSSGITSTTAGPAAGGCPQGCSLHNAVAQCVDGLCVIDQCLPGWEDCDGQADIGCEANTLKYFTDNAHCGGCGQVCLSPLSCSDGVCIMPGPSSSTQPPAGPSSTAGAQQQQQQPPAPPATAPQTPSSSNSTAGDTSSSPATQQQPAPAPAPGNGTTAAAVPKPKPDDSSTGTQPPTTAAPSKPAAPATPAPAAVQPSTPTPQVPVEPVILPQTVPVIYDDFVRITPSDRTLIIDILANDDLGGHAVGDITVSLLVQPAVGAARVLPADPRAVAGSVNSRPRVEYRSAGPVAAGSEVQVYYSVAVTGEKDVPAPGTVTILGAIAKPDSGLLDCSPTHKSVPGDVLTALSHADDATASVTLPFPVDLLDAAYTTATVSTNGWVSFGTSGASEPCTIPTSWPGAPCLGTGPVLAVFWDDLVPDTVLTHYDKESDAFIIQWSNVMFSGSNTPMGTFQTYVFQNGTLGYVYRDVFGADASLGSEAIIGVRGPSSRSAAYRNLMSGKQYSELGSTADPHGSWYWAATADVPDYVITTAAQSRLLNPGLALISQPVRSVRNRSASSPGSFRPWRLDPKQPLPLLISTNSPSRPELLQLTARLTPGGVGQVATISWSMPTGSIAVQQFRLYVAADALFSEMLRQPAGNAFEMDIASSTRSVDVVLDRRLEGRSIYVLVMACYKDACARSCTGQFALHPTYAAAVVKAVR